MKEKMFVIPGSFVPYNDTVTLLTYKRLRNLDLDMDVFAFKGQEDKSLLQELNNDSNYKKFSTKYMCDYDDAIAIKHPSRIFKSIYLMNKYIKESIKEFEKNNYKYLYTSSVPGISHICGKRIKEKNPEVIWYASFSDPIKGSPYKNDPYIKNEKIIERIVFKVGSFLYMNNKYEEAAVRYADKLIFICEEQKDFTISQYHNLNKDELIRKSIIMPLTYIKEWDLYKEMITNDYSANKPIKAVHLGRLYGLRKIDTFLLALKDLKKEDPSIENKIQFHQYSEIQSSDVKKIKEYGLDNLFILHDKVSYDKSTNIMKEADALILFDTLLPNEPNQPYLPSKIVEYLLLKKPILGICDSNSPSYRILSKYGFDTVGSDVETIKKNIKFIISSQKVKDYSLNELNSDNYNMIEL